MGINVMLTPHVGAHMLIAGMTSARGRCHTLDMRADGYSRGEACTACSNSSLSGIQEHIVVMSGSAVRQDGKTASLTAPNGKMQTNLVKSALLDANVFQDAWK